MGDRYEIDILNSFADLTQSWSFADHITQVNALIKFAGTAASSNFMAAMDPAFPTGFFVPATGKTIEFVAKVSGNSNSVLAMSGGLIFKIASTYYSLQATIFDSSTNSFRLQTVSTPAGSSPTSYTCSQTSGTTNYFTNSGLTDRWVRIVITDDDTMTFFHAIQTVKPKDSEWVQMYPVDGVGTNFTPTTPFTAVTEFGARGINNAHNNATHYAYVGQLQAITGGGIAISNSVIDGVTIQVGGIYTRNSIGKMGAIARIAVHDPRYTNVTTLKGALNTVATVSDTQFGNRLFQGEIKSYDPINRTFDAEGIDKKLSTTLCQTDPRFFIGEVEMLNGNTLYKKDLGSESIGAFSSYNIVANMMVGFIKTDYKRYKAFPTTITPLDESFVTATPDTNEGGIPQLFYELDDSFTDAQRFWHIRDTDNTYTTLHAQMQFTNIIREASTTQKINIRVVASVQLTQGLTTTQGKGAILIYDYTNTTWRTLQDNCFSTDLYKQLAFDFTLPDDLPAGVLSDYISESSANTYGFVTQTMKIIVKSPPTGASQILDVKVGYCHMEYILDTEQIQELMVGKIQTVNADNLVFYPASSLSWATEDIRNDGISSGDTFIITKSVSDIFDDIMNNSNLNLILGHNFEPTDEYPDIEDLRYTTVLEFITKWEEQLNGMWVINYTYNPVSVLPTLYFRTATIPDVVDGDGAALVLTDADIINWRGGARALIDTTREKANVYVIGANGIVYIASNTVEHTPDLGAESIVYRKPDLETYRQVKLYGDSTKLRHRDADRELTFVIDMNIANQDYSDIAPGKYIQVKLPADGSVINFTTGNDGKLLISQVEYNRIRGKQWRDYITLTCRVRVLS